VWWPIWLLIGFVVVLPVGDAINAFAKHHPECRVLSVIDGDTVKLFCPEGGAQAGRILGYDTPEVDGACTAEIWAATKATFFLRWKLWSATVIRARVHGRDKYKRALVQVDLDGTNVAQMIISAGLARPYDGGKREGWCA
jgi:endonuclease YncB( thermonuclease family)